MTRLSNEQQRIVGLLVLLFGITYLDRVCISVAGPQIQDDLQIGPEGWGWVTGVFTISYGLFEIPTGMLGDRKGPRKVLTRIVLWWSAFTALTGVVTTFVPLLVTRFLFGAGEAGAFPNASVVIARWFPRARRATLFGVLLMASQMGGALAPVIFIPIQTHYGWRVPFYVLGMVGVLWSITWYSWFRDRPTRPIQSQEATDEEPALAQGVPWQEVLRSRSILALLGTAFCYVYVYNFFQTWFHTFLIKGRAFSENGLLLSTLPFLVAIAANLAGGAVSDHLVRTLGAKRGRRLVSVVALTLAGMFTVAAMCAREPMVTVLCLATVYGAITFQQSGVFGVCVDIGQAHAGAMVGLMNTAAQVGGLVGSVAYGYIVARFGNYDAPFIPMAVLLFLGAALWFAIDASQELGTMRPSMAPPLAI